MRARVERLRDREIKGRERVLIWRGGAMGPTWADGQVGYVGDDIAGGWVKFALVR